MKRIEAETAAKAKIERENQDLYLEQIRQHNLYFEQNNCLLHSKNHKNLKKYPESFLLSQLYSGSKFLTRI
jgi:hypothetical protein